MLDQTFPVDIFQDNEGGFTLDDLSSDPFFDGTLLDLSIPFDSEIPLHSTFDGSYLAEFSRNWDCDISSISKQEDAAVRLDLYDELDFELDPAIFLPENSEIPVTSDCAQRAKPLTVSTDNTRLEQHEDKATDPKTQSSATQANNSFTPSFKATVQGQNQITQPPLLPRRSKLDAIVKLKKIANGK
ncbi:MAG: hypothetical protein AB7V32_08250 [Candidatus Berkiella sp.]